MSTTKKNYRPSNIDKNTDRTFMGVWLDKEKAYIITHKNDTIHLENIASEVENFRIHGGSGTRFKGGPQDVVQDSRYLEREKHQLKSFFKKISDKIRSADALVIFGPAEANEKFYKELQENYKDLHARVEAVKKADSMTENQLKAWVRDFFNLNK